MLILWLFFFTLLLTTLAEFSSSSLHQNIFYQVHQWILSAKMFIYLSLVYQYNLTPLSCHLGFFFVVVHWIFFSQSTLLFPLSQHCSTSGPIPGFSSLLCLYYLFKWSYPVPKIQILSILFALNLCFPLWWNLSSLHIYLTTHSRAPLGCPVSISKSSQPTLKYYFSSVTVIAADPQFYLVIKFINFSWEDISQNEAYIV